MTVSFKPDAKMISHLNVILKNELTAINQYFLHARTLQHLGYDLLGKKVYEESIDEMKHADLLIKRILFLGGLPNLQDLGKIRIGENVKEMLEADFALELDAIPALRDAIAYADESRDYVSVELLTSILVSEESHYDWLRKQIHLFADMGKENYLQSAVE